MTAFWSELVNLEAEFLKWQMEKRLSCCVPWNRNIKWEPELNIQANSYKPLELFPGLKVSDPRDVDLKPDQHVDSPDGRWRYVVRDLPRGQVIKTFSNNGHIGSVIFDGPVRIPALYERWPSGRMSFYPWMSITPMEIISLRPGTRWAKGNVIVAGLGLGHQLIEVSRRKQVDGLTLIEIDQTLVDWLWPKIYQFTGADIDIEIVVGDAKKLLPGMVADVALLDIFPAYGGNNEERDEIHALCPNIKRMWAWGGKPVKHDGWC